MPRPTLFLPAALRQIFDGTILPDFHRKLGLWFSMHTTIGLVIALFIYSYSVQNFWKVLAVVQIITQTIALFTGIAGVGVGVHLQRSHELRDLLRLLPFTSFAALLGATLAAWLARLVNPAVFSSLQEWFFGPFLPVLCINVMLSIVAYRLTRRKPAPAAPPAQTGATTTADRSILIREKRNQYRVALRAVVYLAAHGNQTVVHTDEQSFTTPTSMKEFEADLPRPQFQRIHRSYIVQTARIREIRYHQGGTYLVSLSDEDETQLPVGRTFVRDLKAVLDSRSPA